MVRLSTGLPRTHLDEHGPAAQLRHGSRHRRGCPYPRWSHYALPGAGGLYRGADTGEAGRRPMDPGISRGLPHGLSRAHWPPARARGGAQHRHSGYCLPIHRRRAARFRCSRRRHHHVIADGVHLRQTRLIVHSAALSPRELCPIAGVTATTAARTAIDLARTAPRLDALAVLDAALRTGRVSPRALEAQLDRQHGSRGIVAARELVSLADGRAESPMESRSRLRCLDGGLPSPELQVEVRSGRRRYRIDLGWRRQKVGLEYDSLAFHGGHATLRYDRERHNWLTAQGWTMIYATARQILSAPDELIAQLAYALDVTRDASEVRQTVVPRARGRTVCRGSTTKPVRCGG